MTIIEAIFPILLVALIGYGVARMGALSVQDIDGISRFVFNIAIPVFLFNSLVHTELPAQINWQFMFSYYVVVLLIYSLGIWASRRWFSYSRQDQGLFGLGASYSNMILVGLPVISSGLGDAALLPLFMLTSIHSALLFFIVTLLVENGKADGRSAREIAVQTLSNVVRNPIIISLALGLLGNWLKVPIPKLADNVLSMFSQTTLPCALFVLGASFNAYKITDHLAEAWVMVGLKMALHPLLVWILAFGVFHLDPLWGTVAVMTAGMPVGVNAYVFAQKYDARVATISTAIVLSTLLAVVSQSVFLALFV